MGTPLLHELTAASCGYCGRENPDRLSACAGCGTPLASAPPPAQLEPERKSKSVAVSLAFIFGPLGLFYVGAWWPAFVIIIIAAPFILTHKGGLWLTVGSRIICAIWAYHTVVEQDEASNARRDSARFLDEAARLEDVDRAKAIAAYEKIVQLYPRTPAAREAARNVEALKRQAC